LAATPRLILKDADHGRKETRTALVPPSRIWPKTTTFPVSRPSRDHQQRGRDKTVRRYFLLTQCNTPAELLRIVRQLWNIENALHWTPDVDLDEDQARGRKDHAPANLAVLRRLAVNPRASARSGPRLSVAGLRRHAKQSEADSDQDRAVRHKSGPRKLATSRRLSGLNKSGCACKTFASCSLKPPTPSPFTISARAAEFTTKETCP